MPHLHTITGTGVNARQADQGWQRESDAFLGRLKDAGVPQDVGEESLTLSASYALKTGAEVPAHYVRSFTVESTASWDGVAEKAETAANGDKNKYDATGFTKSVVVSLSDEQHAVLESRASPTPASYERPPADSAASSIFG